MRLMQIFPGVPVILNWAVLIMAFFLSTAAEAVLIGDKDWRQPAETTGFSWEELANGVNPPCDPWTGECNGSLRGFDFTGWTWASRADVGEMFALTTPLDFPNESQYSASGEAWAEALIDTDGFGPDEGLFDPTIIVDFQGTKIFRVWGVSRTTNRVAIAPIAYDILDPTYFDQVTMDASASRNDATHLRGVWLYRDASEIPEPNSILLIVIGFSSMFLWRKRWCHWPSGYATVLTTAG